MKKLPDRSKNCIWLTGFLLLFLVYPGQAQQDCNRYGRSFRKLQSLKNSYPRDEKKYRQESGVAALLLEQCLESRGEVSNEERVETTYMLGKHFLDADNCEKASYYFRQCMENPASETLSGHYRQRAQDFYLVCHRTGHGSEGTTYRIVRSYNGKGGLTDHYFDTLQNMPPSGVRTYFSDEIEVLQERIYRAEDHETAIASLKALSGASHALYKKPFLLLLVSGDVSNVWRDSRITNVVDKEMVMHETERLSANADYLEQFYRYHLEPTYTYLRDRYFDRMSEEYILPVYIFDHPFNAEGSRQFGAFCERLHYQSAGNRVGYFNSYDKSLVTWINSGTGTFVHELVHALVHYDFPDAPEWLNEGIAAMYEESRNYRPLDNWRLVYIKTAYDNFGTFASLENIFAMEGAENNYQQLMLDAYSRYFCVFLEGEGLLPDVYRNLRDSDPQQSDIEVVQTTLRKSLDTLQQQFNCLLYQSNDYGSWNYGKYIRDVSRYTLAQPEFPLGDSSFDAKRCKKRMSAPNPPVPERNHPRQQQIYQEPVDYLPRNQMIQQQIDQ